MNHEADHQPERVDNDMALAALDLLARIIASDAAAFRGFDALAVDHTRRWRSLAPIQFPCVHNKVMVDPCPQTHGSPFIEIALH